MKKFTKGLAICGAVLMGSMMFSGCALTQGQQDALDSISKRVNDLVEVLDRQNMNITKTDAVKMVEVARARLNNMYGISSMKYNKETAVGDSVEDADYAYKNKTVKYAASEQVRVNDSDVGARIETITDKTTNSVLLYKSDYPKDVFYKYSDGMLQAEVEDIDVDARSVDFIGQSLKQVREEDIYEVQQNHDGSYSLIIYTERTLGIDNKETPEEKEDDEIQNVLCYGSIVIHNGRIVSYKGYFHFNTYAMYDEDGEEIEYQVDNYGNYILRYDETAVPTSSSVEYFKINYSYDEDVNTSELYRLYTEAEAKYREDY